MPCEEEPPSLPARTLEPCSSHTGAGRSANDSGFRGGEEGDKRVAEVAVRTRERISGMRKWGRSVQRSTGRGPLLGLFAVSLAGFFPLYLEAMVPGVGGGESLTAGTAQAHANAKAEQPRMLLLPCSQGFKEEVICHMATPVPKDLEHAGHAYQVICSRTRYALPGADPRTVLPGYVEIESGS